MLERTVIEGAPEDNPVDSDFGEGLKGECFLLFPPLLKGFERLIANSDIVKAQFVSCEEVADVDVVPVVGAYFVKDLHVVEPGANSVLAQDIILDELGVDDGFACAVLEVVVVIRAVDLVEAVFG